MKQKHLEVALSSLQREFPDPKVTLEQYPTSAHLTAAVICLAVEKGDLGEKEQTEDSDDDSDQLEEIDQDTGTACTATSTNIDTKSTAGSATSATSELSSVCDLGCGTGMLATAAAFCSDLVFAVDCDPDAIAIARTNAAAVELDDAVHFIQAQLRMKALTPNQRLLLKQLNKQSGGGRRGGRGGGTTRGGRGRGKGRGRGSGNKNMPHQQNVNSEELNMLASTKGRLATTMEEDGIPLPDNCVKTVLTNPPFGTKHNAGIDMQFLRTATRLATRAVYSFHKTTTRNFVIQTVEEWGHTAQVVAEMKFDIPQMYKFHKQKSVDVAVDLIRVQISPLAK